MLRARRDGADHARRMLPGESCVPAGPQPRRSTHLCSDPARESSGRFLRHDDVTSML